MSEGTLFYVGDKYICPLCGKVRRQTMHKYFIDWYGNEELWLICKCGHIMSVNECLRLRKEYRYE